MKSGLIALVIVGIALSLLVVTVPANAVVSHSSTNIVVPTNCKSVNGLPDSTCTPGDTNPSVTQSNIGTTICVSGYTQTIRPPTSYTTPLKILLMKSYGMHDFKKNYELDHLISLELGGAPSSVANLWPEPYIGANNAHVKDKFENYLHKQVCAGTMSLQEAQKEISTNWVFYYEKVGKPKHPESSTDS